MSLPVVWLILAAVFLVVELVTVGMVSIWFLVGSIAGLLLAVLGAAIWLQFVCFLVVSLLCFIILYPRLKHLIRRRQQPTNADMVIGRTAIVTRRIDDIAGTGAVAVNGRTWTARTAHGEIAEEGAIVRVTEIQGVKLIVTPENNA